MYKLGALDAGFLYNETGRSPQHIASVQILELPEGVDEAQYVSNLKAMLLERIHLVPYFTNKLKFVPFDLDHPVWVRDKDFDINNHVLTIEVPAPGDRKALEKTIARLHEVRLDRNRPLWDLWILTGLEGGKVAAYNRSHHACLDGVAGQVMIQTIMDITEEPRSVEPAPKDFFAAAPAPGAGELFASAAENFARFQAKQPLAAFTAMETAGRLFRRAFDPSKGLGATAERAPKTRFNRAIERERSYATGEVPLDSVKNIAAMTGTKINDVFLAVCAGGLRRYFERTGELPDASLIAGCPVSLRKPGDENTNNQVTMMLVSMATSESDPAERLQTIAQSARTAKGFTQDIAPSYDSDVALPGLPAAFSRGVRFAEFTRAANLPGVQAPCNIVVSNVPGPQLPLYFCGAKVMTHYPVSIPAHTQGVNITVQSYNGDLYFAVTACAKALPDADRLRDDMVAAFEELKELYDLPTVPVAMQQKEVVDEGSEVAPKVQKASDEQSKAA